MGLPINFALSSRSQGHYKGLVDEWYVWDSLEDEFRLAQAWND
jgi:hypothetical protein